MVRWFHKTATFDSPWNDVTSVFWSKFPNKNQPYIRAVDTFDRSLDPETGIMTVRRLITHHTPGPRWMYALGFPDTVSAIEEIQVDPTERTFTMKTKNITAASIFQVAETVVYSENEEKTTDYEQNIQITSFLPVFPGLAEDFSHGTCVKNSGKGINTMNGLIAHFKETGIQGTKDRFINALDLMMRPSDNSDEAKFDAFTHKVKMKTSQWISKADLALDTVRDDLKDLAKRADAKFDDWRDELKDDIRTHVAKADAKFDALVEKADAKFDALVEKADAKFDELVERFKREAAEISGDIRDHLGVATARAETAPSGPPQS